jgi:tetratricopeptide (TPR) repeat protein
MQNRSRLRPKPRNPSSECPCSVDNANLAERDSDLASAATHLERAVASGKPNSDVADELGNLNVLLGRFDRAIAFHRYAGELDPMSPYAHGHLGYDYIALGRFDEGIASARLALALSPDSEWWRLTLVNGLLLKGEAQAALDESAAWKGSAGRRFAAAIAYPLVGRAVEGERALAELVAHEGKWFPYAIAVAFAQRGDADGAFEWLERTESAGPASLVGLHADPNLRMLHDDPRWPMLMKRLGQTREKIDAVAFDVALPGS